MDEQSNNSTPPATPQPTITPAEQHPTTLNNESNDQIAWANKTIADISSTYKKYIIGQNDMLDSILVTLLSNGHLLLEGVPGLAKTTAAHTIAATIGADFVRIQCTPDMLPSDIIGSQIYNQDTHEFITDLGPINHQFILVDEINRTGAKTQSALLEAMQERQVSIGGKTHKLLTGFIVIATQNPIEQEGTYPLPEAQLDRFLIKHILSYPTPKEEISIMQVKPTTDNINAIQNTINIENVLQLQKIASNITADERILTYIANLVAATRNPESYNLTEIKQFIEIGASPRASIALLACGRAAALMSGSSYVTPDHIKPYLQRVLRHRIIQTYEAEAENVSVEQIIDKIGSVVSVP